jgi:hypothetical protein
VHLDHGFEDGIGRAFPVWSSGEQRAFTLRRRRIKGTLYSMGCFARVII